MLYCRSRSRLRLLPPPPGRWGGSTTQAWKPDDMSLDSDCGMILTAETEELGKTCPSPTLSTTNPTWIVPGANPGLCGERPATNDLNHGMALGFVY
jgi:hypothetical protein